MGEEARMGAANGPFRKAGAAGRQAQNAISSAASHRQNVMEMEPELDRQKELSKIEDEPVMLMKKSNLISGVLSHPVMFMKTNDLIYCIGIGMKTNNISRF